MGLQKNVCVYKWDLHSEERKGNVLLVLVSLLRFRSHRKHRSQQFLYCCVLIRCVAMTPLFDDVIPCLLFHCLSNG
jgi:hypothetical protein